MTTSILDPRQFPQFIGVDELGRRMERMLDHGSRQSYPPYNVIRDGENVYHIELAVAGFDLEELSVTQNADVLEITGTHSSAEEAEYLHKGISSRDFKRVFTLADHVNVVESNLVNGILSITLEREIPEELKPREIKINR